MHVLFIFIFFVWMVKGGNSQEQQASNVEFCAHNKHNGVDSPMGTKRQFVSIDDYNALPWLSFTYDYWQDLAPAMRVSSQLRGEDNSKLSATWGDPGSNDGPQQLFGTSPRFADLDSDGDLDLVVGISPLPQSSILKTLVHQHQPISFCARAKVTILFMT